MKERFIDTNPTFSETPLSDILQSENDLMDYITFEQDGAVKSISPDIPSDMIKSLGKVIDFFNYLIYDGDTLKGINKEAPPYIKKSYKEWRLGKYKFENIYL